MTNLLANLLSPIYSPMGVSTADFTSYLKMCSGYIYAILAALVIMVVALVAAGKAKKGLRGLIRWNADLPTDMYALIHGTYNIEEQVSYAPSNYDYFKGTYTNNGSYDDFEQGEHYLELSVKMAPITPDHHFYIDQGIYSHMRVAFVRIGEAMVRAGILDDAEDIFMLKYDEIRSACCGDYPVKERVQTRRAEMEATRKRPPQEWYGTATEWQVYNEPYKSLWGYPQKFEAEQQEKESKAEISKTVLKGIPGCPGCQEGVAHLVSDPSELDTVKEGEILVCKMTNPAWVVSFSKISALVTDTGGALSHPAVVAREFGVPCVVGTRRATQLIKTGDKIRVDGSKGVVEVIG